MLRTVIGGAVAATIAMIAPAAHAQTAPRAVTAQGPVVGATDGGVLVFRGLPYAAPPVGPRRWAPPAAPAGWSDVRSAAKFGPACPQTLAPNGRAPWTVEYMHPVAVGISEDCLTLNIWTPRAAPGSGLPVLVFFHGGGYVEGSGAIPTYDGANMARRGVVVVNLNYRLGALGYMAHPALSAEQGGASGNYGLQDQIAALRWVQQNISAFGGDPAKVTISGQSAGAGSVVAILAAPSARGLYRAAIVESMGAAFSDMPRTPLETAEKTGAEAMKRAGAETLDQARALSAEQVMASGFRGGLIADGRLLATGSGAAPLGATPLIVGFTLHDAGRRHPTAAAWKTDVATRYGAKADAFLKLSPAESDAAADIAANKEVSERIHLQPLRAWRAATPNGGPVFAYVFSHVEPGLEAQRWGAFHTSDVPYVFDTLDLSPNRAFTDLDRRVAATVQDYWVSFIKTGDPNGGGLPRWPAMAGPTPSIMDLGDVARAIPAVRPEAEALYAGSAPPSARP